MTPPLPSWRRPGIAGKLRLGFGLLFFLIFWIMASWLFSLHLANQAGQTIATCAAIERTILNMDRLLEKARRLHDDFLLQYGRVGLAEAHEQFAQPSARSIAEAVAASAELQQMLSAANTGKILGDHHVDLNLYLATARRFADTSVVAIDLITRLANPEHGLEPRLERLLTELRTAATPFAPLDALCRELRSSSQEYRITHQRHHMQSSFNTLGDLRRHIEATMPLDSIEARHLYRLIEEMKTTGGELLAVDQAIKNTFNDFNIQAANAQPIARLLVHRAGVAVQNAQTQVARTFQTAMILLAAVALAAVVAALLGSRFISRNITQRIQALGDCTDQFQKGRLQVTAPELPMDELGQLGRTFNAMSGRIRTLVDDLESTIEQRTRQLGESERRFRRIADELPNVGIIGFGHDGRVFFWNLACEKLYGHTGPEAQGETVASLVADPTHQDDLHLQPQRHIDEAWPIAAGEVRLRHKNGTPVQVFVSYFTVSVSEDRQEHYSLHIDLTELKKTQEERDLHESIYRSLFEHTSSGVAVLAALEEGRDFLIKDFNPAAERIESRRRFDLLDNPLSTCFPSVVTTGFLDTVRQVWLTGEPVYLPPMPYDDQGHQRWRQGHLYRIPTGEVVVVYDDITVLKEAELEHAAMEAQLHRARKMEAIGLMAGGVAHDLNNILSGIVSYPDLMLMQLPPDSRLRKPILAILDSGQRAAAVVADLLTVARGVSSERKICSLATLTQEYLDSPEHEALLARYPDVACTTRFADNLWSLSCSPVHVKKSLMNLVTNAAEALEHTGRITLLARNEELEHTRARLLGIEPGNYVVLEVADSGPGIAPADIDHVFEPFYSKKVLGRSGTGLGLAVVWNTMQDHQGTVTVASSEQGTVFTLLFPAAEQPSGPAGALEETAIPRGRDETILIVDDESLQREIAGQSLESLGYRTVSCASGEEALAYLATHRVDLILQDMLMGTGINGRETYEQALRLHPGQKALIVSGFSESDDVHQALRLGAAGYVQKPYSLKTLGTAVHAALHDLR